MPKPLPILALLLSTLTAPAAHAFVINPFFIGPDSWTPNEEAVVNQAITDWTSHVAFEGANDQIIPISFYFTSAGNSYLAQWQFAKVTAEFPYSPTMTHWIAINSDFLSQDSFTLGPPVAGQFDMLTVFEHELGHAMGFAPGVYNIDPDTNKWLNHIDGNTFDPAGLNIPMRPDNAHVNLPSDLMYFSLPRGIRKPISQTDLDMLSLAYNYTTTPVPEPTTLALFTTTLPFLLAKRVKRRRNATELPSALASQTTSRD